MGNTDKFEQIAHAYDTLERIQTAKVSSDAIRNYLLTQKTSKRLISDVGQA